MDEHCEIIYVSKNKRGVDTDTFNTKEEFLIDIDSQTHLFRFEEGMSDYAIKCHKDFFIKQSKEMLKK